MPEWFVYDETTAYGGIIEAPSAEEALKRSPVGSYGGFVFPLDALATAVASADGTDLVEELRQRTI